ncbi:MAG: dGTP triphosphohydrolase [Bacillota bacterium]
MSHEETWVRLLNEGRFRVHSEPRSPVDGRNEFEDDYTRIVFSSAVRRLQDKAQVFPLDNSDFVRTRLTHSIETSAIGRSIGSSVEEEMSKRYPFFCRFRGRLSAILATVGFAHDLGNPPFGHFGEKAIRSFFVSYFSGNTHGLTEAQRADLERFEGNAQTFRLLTRLQYLIGEEGFNLTFGTLASQMKYPCSSLEVKDGTDVRCRKNGYFQSEKDRFERVRDETGIGHMRHPLAFLLEAADDIAYSAADIEDGLKKNVIDIGIIRETIRDQADRAEADPSEVLAKLDKYLGDCHKDYPDKDEIAVQRFRIYVQGQMIASVVKEFLARHDSMLDGTFTSEILAVSEAGWIREAFKTLAVKVFHDRQIMTRELAGERVIEGLLREFTAAVDSDRPIKKGSKEEKLYLLVSPNYRFMCETYPSARQSGCPSLYDRLLLVTDFVCGMTDSYALSLYRKLTGMTLE